MAVSTERRAKKTATRLDQALLTQPLSNAMAFDGSDTDSGGAVVDTVSPSPTEVPGFKSALRSQEAPAQSHMSSKKGRTSRAKVPSDLRRASSTPHMRSLALGAGGDLSPTSNKPRNKLGYHRTSVACGHCRRRKIRCLLANEDPQGRCANCIRLKKECNFYPVEHHSDMQRNPSVIAKDTSPGQPSTPTSSSPRRSSQVSSEKMPEFRAPFGNAPSAPQPAGYAYHGEGELDPHQMPVPAGSMPIQHRSYAYSQPLDTQWPPTNSFLPSSTVAESPSSNASYWRQSPSTTTSVYGSESNVSGGHTPAAMSTSSTMSYGPQDSHWGQQQSPYHPPTRSMSYGNIEGMQQQYPGQGLGIQHDYSRRTSPYPYPTSIDTNPATLHSTTLGSSTSAPLSAPIVSSHPFYQPPTWNGSYDAASSHGPAMPVPGRSMSAQWFGEHGHLDRVQEEGPPTMAYNPHVPQFYSNN